MSFGTAHFGTAHCRNRDREGVGLSLRDDWVPAFGVMNDGVDAAE